MARRKNVARDKLWLLSRCVGAAERGQVPICYHGAMTIERFRGEYLLFSNMCPLEEWIKTDQGILVPTSEHAYMANRFADPEIHSHVASARGAEEDGRSWKDGDAAKKIAHQYIELGYPQVCRNDNERVAIMREVVRKKLANNAEILELLLQTGQEEIYEGNDWGDNFWGVSPVGEHTAGLNHLGRIYMELRTEFS